MSSQLSLCGEEIRNNDHDQFLCGLFMPEDKHDAFFALHFFYLETARIRDLVGEPHLGLIRLQWWRDLVDGIYNDQQTHTEHGTHKEIVSVLSEKKIEKALFDSYFNARSFDMEDMAHDDLNALLRYAKATGGNIAKMKAALIRVEEVDAIEKIGTAMVLIDLIRSLAFQARKGHCKIPTAIVRKHQLDMKSFHDFETGDALKACVKEIACEVETLIHEARTLKADKKAQAILLSTVSIEDYLKRLKKVSYDPFNPNVGGGRLSKQLKLAFKAWRGAY